MNTLETVRECTEQSIQEFENIFLHLVIIVYNSRHFLLYVYTCGTHSVLNFSSGGLYRKKLGCEFDIEKKAFIQLPTDRSASLFLMYSKRALDLQLDTKPKFR